MTKKKTQDVAIDEITIPNGMQYFAQKEFDRIKPLLKEAGVLALDQAVLISYLMAVDTYTRARKDVEKRGAIIVNAKGNEVQNPYHNIMVRNFEIMKKAADALGLTVSSRKRLGINIDVDGVGDIFS